MNKARLKNIVSATIIFLLVCSFSLHAIQIPHSHQGHQDSQHGSHEQEKPLSSGMYLLGEYMHAAEKKLILILAPTMLLSGAYLFGTWATFIFLKNNLYLLWLKRRKLFICKVHNHLALFLSHGILNPKLY